MSDERPFYYSPTPRLVFKSYSEKRSFKQAVKRTLREQLGYTQEIDFLRDIYTILATGDVQRLIEFLQDRYRLYSKMNGKVVMRA